MNTTESEETGCGEISGYNCKKYKLHGVESTGRSIGQESHSSVVEVHYKGLICAAKKYNLSTNNNNQHSGPPVDQNEHSKWCYNLCQLLGQLKHPNLVQFLGFYHELESLVPVLVFEHLHISLADCLVRYVTIPEGIALSILKDVATALRYLHGCPMPVTLQHSLSASNVLLANDMTAKLANVGVNCIVEFDFQTMEAVSNLTNRCQLSEKTISDIKLKTDIYFFGLLMVHLLTGRNPAIELTEYYQLNYSFSISEIDVVQNLLGEVYEEHPLLSLIEMSLDINPLARPSIISLQQKISQVSSKNPPLFLNSLDMLHKIESDKEQQLSLQGELKKLSPQESEEIALSYEVERLSDLLSKVSEQNMLLRARLGVKDSSEILLKADWDSIDMGSVSVDPDKRLQRQENHCISNPIEIRQGHIKWTKYPDLPVGMFQAQGIYLRNKIYIGGGDTGNFSTDSLVFEYNFETKTWRDLPPTPVTYFGLCKLEGELVIVGGKLHNDMPTSSVYVFDYFTKRWKDSIPSLNFARYSPSCTSTQSAIIVVGGSSIDNEILSSIEVIKSDTFQWYTAGYLSRSATLCHANTTTINETLYLLGGYKSTTANSSSNSTHSSPVNIFLNRCGMIPHSWSSLSSTPHYQSTSAYIGPCLVSLGGTTKPYSPPVHQSMYGYCTSTNTWIFVAHLPYAFCHATAVSFPNNEIFIMGGWVQQGKFKRTCEVYHGSVTT